MPAKNARDIFLAALDCPLAERAAYLDAACGDDVIMRQRVEALLRANDEPAAFLSQANPGAVVVDGRTATFGSEPSETSDFLGRNETIGAILGGKYKLIEEIGEGGMGSVFMAQQTEPVKRAVAVKVIKAGMDSKAVLARFEAERQALAMMDHPNIAKVLDAGTTESGRPYFVMELVKGTPITQYCDERKLTPKERLELFVPVCQAIQHAHQKGIIHRDIKPSNVLVAMYDDRPVPKVIDFGVAKATGQSLTDKTLMTGFGAIVGTPEYMSPEQANMNNLDIDTRSDVYSLGVLLYELLTGSTPVDRKSLGQAALLEILRIVREVEAPRPSAKLSTINTLPSVAANRGTEPAKLSNLMKGELDWVLLKALEKDRTRRYDTANALARDIQQYLANEMVEARPPSASYRLNKFVKRNKGQVIAASLVFLALLAGMVGTAVGMIEAKKQERLAVNAQLAEAERAEGEAVQKQFADLKAAEAIQEAKRADAEKQEAIKQLDRSERLAYAGKLSLAQSAFAEGNAALAIQHLQDCQWNLRGWEHRHLWTRFNSKQTILGHTLPLTSVAWSPAGNRLLSGSADMTIKLWDAENGREILTLKGHTGEVTCVAFSADGKRVVSASYDRMVKLWDSETGIEIRTFQGHTDVVSSVVFSPDGTRLLSGGYDKTLKLWDTEKGTEILTLKGHSLPVSSVAFSPDGKRVLSGSGDKTIKLWDAAKGQVIQTIEGHSFPVSSVTFSPDGKRILSGSYDKSLKIWDADSGKEIFTIKAHARYVSSVAFSPDGKRILSGSWDNTLKLWDAINGQEILTLRGHAALVSSVAFSPDGNRILSCGGYDTSLKVWDAEKGQENLKLKANSTSISSVAFSPDGKRMLSGSEDKSLKLWDAEQGKVILNLSGHTANVTSVAFSADGKRLLSGSFDKTLKLWDADTGRVIFTFLGHTAHVYGVAFSSDGKRLVSGSRDQSLKLWDAEKGTEILTLKGHKNIVTSVAFSPDGKRLLSGSWDKTLKLWDVEKGTEILTLKGHTNIVSSVAFRPDGKRILSGSWDKTLKLWDTETGEEIFTLKGHSSTVSGVAYSPDGKRILSGSYDKTLKLWDADKGQEILTLKGHSNTISSVVFSPDGKRLFSGGSGEYDPQRMTQPGEVILWEAERGQEIFMLSGHLEKVSSVVFSPEGKQIFAWDVQNKLLAWSSETGQPVDPINPPVKSSTGPAISPDGIHTAKPQSNDVAVTNSRIPPTGNVWPLPDAAERKRYHIEQAAEAEKNNQWFAVAFHVGRLLIDDPNNGELKKRREEALRKHATVEVPPSPGAVK